MTIHGSKGLQFDYVLIPFMGDNPQLSTEPLFHFDESTGVASLKVRNKEDDRKHLRFVSKKFEQIREQEELELDRLLYVCMTRAKRSIYLSSQKKYASKSWACHLRAELGDWKIGSSEIQVREFQSNSAQNDEQKVTTDLMGAKKSNTPRSLWKQTSTEGQEVTSQGVTQLIEMISGTKSDMPRPIPNSNEIWRRVQRTEQGVVLHRILEALKYHGVDGVRRLVEKSFNKGVDRIMDALEFVIQSDRPPMSELLKHGHAEWGFSMREGASSGSQNILRGQIDLWGHINGETWIIDYKTGHLRLEKAFFQLEIYARALVTAGKIDKQKPVYLGVIQPFQKQAVIRDFVIN
jgi:ATP-dependent exoDNAse (exonuclease V) beta subunit